jgi:hypothetical protein
VISDEQLKAWQALVDALPEGKWEHRRQSHQGIRYGDPVVLWHGVWFDDIKRQFFWPPYDTKRGRALPAEAMTQFIAASREAVPALLAENARLRAAGRALAPHVVEEDSFMDTLYCGACRVTMSDDEEFVHAADCPVLVFTEVKEE